MWLREVHSRLVDGTYDYVYDFAWDVRLVFANCMEYNAPNSDLCKAAEQLSTEFEHLLCEWVYNVQVIYISIHIYLYIYIYIYVIRVYRNIYIYIYRYVYVYIYMYLLCEWVCNVQVINMCI
jgi:hypothetical protein